MYRNIVVLFVTGFFLIEVNSLIEFSSINCESLDKTFADFEYCRLETVNRTYKYITAKVLLFKKPVSKVRVNAALYKLSNGYKPFLYNVTVDACKFFKKQKSHPVARHLSDLFNGVSNINHACPYDHDLLVDHLSADYFNQHLTNVLTFPKGEYLFQMHVFAYDVNRAVVKLYCSLI